VKKETPVDPVLALVPFIEGSRHREARLLTLQTLYFLIDRRWNGLFLDTQAKIRAQLLPLSRDSDLDIQQWTFICLTAILVKRDTEPTARGGLISSRSSKANVAILDRSPEEESVWREIWEIALRRMNLASGAACRGACLIIHALMRSRFISDARISSAMTGFFDDIITQGPATTFDTVCSFVRAALDYSDNDTKLYRMDYHQKVIIWFRHTWRAAQGAYAGVASSSTNLSIDAIELLVKAAGISNIPTIWTEQASISSDIVNHMTEQTECGPIRDYLLHATLPAQDVKAIADRASSNLDDSASSGAVPIQTLRERRTQILDFFTDTLHETTSTLDLASTIKVKSALDVAVFAIITWAAFGFDNEEPEHTVMETACNLLDKILQQILQHGDYGPQEMSCLLSGLTPVLGQPLVKSRIDRRYQMWPTLTLPDVKAGVTTLATPDESEFPLSPPEQTAAKATLVSVWQSPRVRCCAHYLLRSEWL
jgi:ataxia telangiectasia mutated family protein